ncbi:hypothetical protein O6H91_04G101100 [Diphasiastrum complanatum]|uniref:Uncharacterized protein n=1 Tax=Diphasiastrum complanatum TaxID=34168 RepID=A0ACC2DZK4_DIPCM|nr:hypothetical protein O6H91_04G101100 [Diphasiastrum complanatum]
MTSLSTIIASSENYETSKLSCKIRSSRRTQKSKHDSSDSEDEYKSESSSSSSSFEFDFSDSSNTETDDADRRKKRKSKRKEDSKTIEDKSVTSKVEKLWKINMADLNKKFNYLKVQISKVANKRPKASSLNSEIWCTKCDTFAHSIEDCKSVNVKYYEDPSQEVLFIFQDDATTNYV